MVKLACFLKVRQKLTGSRLSKLRNNIDFQARFVRREKSLVKINMGLEREIFRFPVF